MPQFSVSGSAAARYAENERHFPVFGYLGEAKRAEREGEGFLRDRFLRESILVPVLLHGFWDFSLSVDSPWMTAAFYAFVLVFFLSANHRLRAASEDDQQL